MDKIEPSLSYGNYDERPKLGKYVVYIILIGSIGVVGWMGYTGGKNLERAAIGEYKQTKKLVEERVVIQQTEGQETTITQKNRRWLDNITKKGE